jgi:hypothetical protein
MELDLSKYSATSLDINAVSEINKTALSALKKCYPKQVIKKTNDFIEFGSDYKGSKEKKCSARGIVQKISAKELFIHLYFTDHILGKLSDESELLPLSEMLNCLMKIKTTLTFDVTANFKYSGGKTKSRILLPIKLTADDNFDEVRGVRLVKLADGKNLYTLIIDRPSNKSIFHAAYFSYVGNISEALPQIILEEAVSISKRGIQ